MSAVHPCWFTSAPFVEQEPHDLEVTRERREHQRRLAEGIARVDLGARRKQGLHHGRLARLGSEHEDGAAVGRNGVDVHAALQEARHRPLVIVADRLDHVLVDPGASGGRQQHQNAAQPGEQPPNPHAAPSRPATGTA